MSDFDPWAHAEHYTDEPRTEVQFGVNSGDPAECCDPWFITDDEGTASETAQVIVEPYVMTRTVTMTYGPWEPTEKAPTVNPTERTD